MLTYWDENEKRHVAVTSSTPLPVTGAGSGGPSEITTDKITDATTVGKQVLRAADQAAARSAIGAGTSSLSAMTAAEATTGTATTARSITAAVLAGAIAERLPDSPGDVGAAPIVHQHSAADINAGTLDAARIPTLAQNKVTNLATDLAARIQKSALAGVSAIPDPATATPADVASAFNALLTALKG